MIEDQLLDGKKLSLGPIEKIWVPRLFLLASEAETIGDYDNIPRNMKDIDKWAATIDNRNSWAFLLFMENQPIGLVSFTRLSPFVASCGYFLNHRYHGRGLMPRAISKTCGIIFENHDILRIEAHIAKPNRPSQRAVEKAGFQLEATLRKNRLYQGILTDTLIFGLLNTDQKPPVKDMVFVRKQS